MSRMTREIPTLHYFHADYSDDMKYDLQRIHDGSFNDTTRNALIYRLFGSSDVNFHTDSKDDETDSIDSAYCLFDGVVSNTIIWCPFIRQNHIHGCLWLFCP